MPGQGTSFDPLLNVDGQRFTFRNHITDVLHEKALAIAVKPREKPLCLYAAHKSLHPELTQHDDGSLNTPNAAQFLPAVKHHELYADAPIPRRFNVTDALQGKTALLRETQNVPPLP